VTATTLGGPGLPCSAMRVRRLEAGELRGDERARTEAHVAACGRCQETRRAIAAEDAEVADRLPFETFAAGIAERLARTEPRAAPRRVIPRSLPLALAAGLLLAGIVPLLLRVAPDGGAGYRVKGAAEVTVYLRDGDAARVLPPGEPVPPGAALRVGLAPGARSHAVVALVDADGAAILYAGPAVPGPLPGAVEWTGAGPGALVAVLDDVPIDAEAVRRRIAAAGVEAAAPPGAEIVVRPLARERR
jgi:hypothetical protein